MAGENEAELRQETAAARILEIQRDSSNARITRVRRSHHRDLTSLAIMDDVEAQAPLARQSPELRVLRAILNEIQALRFDLEKLQETVELGRPEPDDLE